MGNVNQMVIVRLEEVYGEPRHVENPDHLYDEYERALGGFSDEVLSRAVSHVIDRHPYPTWPTVGEISRECRRLVPAPEAPDTSRRKFAGPETMFIIQRDIDKLQWQAWMEALAPDTRRRAEETGVITATSRFPNSAANGRFLRVEPADAYRRYVAADSQQRGEMRAKPPTDRQKELVRNLVSDAKQAMAARKLEEVRPEFPDVSRSAFREMQASEPELHTDRLSSISRRMTGEHNE